MIEFLCDYGCGLSAIVQFKNGKHSCSASANGCPTKRAADRAKKAGIAPQWKNGHPRGMKGKRSWNAGSTYEELVGQDRAAEIRQKMAASNIGLAKGRVMSAEGRQKISDAINARYAAGWMPKAGRCKKIKYSSPLAGEVMVDGSWELLLAQLLDKLNRPWKRNKSRFSYHFDSKDRFYTPDLFIESLGLYVEVKGYETDKDRAKWQQFPHKLKVLRKEEIDRIKTDSAYDPFSGE